MRGHDKTVVSCSESIDLGSWAGRMLASVIAGLAEGELETIRETSRGSRRKLREPGRWAGGNPPFGYTAVKTAEGWSLGIDPEAHQVVRRIVNDVIDGKTLGRIGRELTEEGHPSPAAYYAAQKGRQAGEGKWEATRYGTCSAPRPFVDTSTTRGTPSGTRRGCRSRWQNPWSPWTSGTCCRQLWTRFRPDTSVLDPRRPAPWPVSLCASTAGFRLHHSRNAVKRDKRRYVYRNYRCQTRRCVAIPAETLETLAEEAFLYEVGDLEVRERVWVPGDTHEADLREAVTALDELTQAAGRARSATGKQRLQKQLDALDARIADLESAPARKPAGSTGLPEALTAPSGKPRTPRPAVRCWSVPG